MIGVFVGFSSIFLLGILIFKGLTARRLYKSFGSRGVNMNVYITMCMKPHGISRLVGRLKTIYQSLQNVSHARTFQVESQQCEVNGNNLAFKY
jgi:hypothetical protein